MIITEHYKTRKDGVILNRTYSDAGLYIIQNETNIEYAEAVDVENAPYTYTETDKPIEAEADATDADYQEALENLGVNFDE